MSRPTLPGSAWPVAVLVALGGTSAAAQTALTQQGPASVSPPAGTFLFSAGADLAGWDNILGRNTPGAAVQVGYQHRVGGEGSRFALRLAGDYWRSGGNTIRAYDRPDIPSPYRRSTRLYGANLLGVMQLRTHGAVRPYALAGVGVYQYVGTNQTAPSPGGGSREVLLIGGDRATSFAYTVGMGVSARVGPVTPFAELRVLHMVNLHTDNVATVRMPLTLGARLAF